jgi:hypothetical protein
MATPGGSPVFENNVLKKIFGVNKDDLTKRNHIQNQFHNICSSPNIVMTNHSG